MTRREIIQEKYDIARKNLLIMIVLTVINIVLILLDSSVIMLFSATIPYFATAIALTIRTNIILVFGLSLAIILLLAYLICWIFSKKHYGWMIFALVLFIIDTICMIALYIFLEDFSGILDVIMHVWIVYYLGSGVINGKKLKSLPEEENVKVIDDNYAYFTSQTSFDFTQSKPLRKADQTVKSRILLEIDYNNHHICYRRVKRINELVIDGYVYADIEMLIENAHALNANINGHVYQVGFDGLAHSYLRVDGKTILKQLRLY